MKKVYSKPNIVYEDFTPSTSIAVGCETIANQTLDSCAVEFPDIGISIFLNEMEACVDWPVDDGSKEANGVCYHNPSPGNNVFIS